MFAKRLRPGFRFLILIVMGALAVGIAVSTATPGARAQDSTDDGDEGQVPLGELFEQAFQAVAGVTNPSNRLYSAGQFAEADVKYGQGRYAARLVALLGPAVAAVPADRRPQARV